MAYIGGTDPQIHLLDLATGESRQLTNLRPEDGTPLTAAGPMRPALTCGFGPFGLAWSPDGSLLAFHYGGCEAVIWVVDVDGMARRIADGTGPAWTPAGTQLVFSPNRPWFPCGIECLGDEPTPGAWSLQVVEIAGDATPRPLGTDGATFGGYSPTWSPDGDQIAFSGPLPTDDASAEYVSATYVVKVTGAEKRLIARGGWPFGWLPDGRLLIMEELTGDMRALDVDSTDAEPIGGGIQAVSPDGARLLRNVTDPVTGVDHGSITDLHGEPIASLDGRAETWSPGGEWLLATEAEPAAILVHDRDGALIGRYEVPAAAGPWIGQLRWRPDG